MSLVPQFLLVFVGGALGGVARYWVSGVVARRSGETFPWGTLVVNVSGALLLGILAGGVIAAGAPPSQPGWLFLAVGVLGSYTTVSSFSLQTLELMRGGESGRAVADVALSFALCVAASAGGLLAVLAFFGA